MTIVNHDAEELMQVWMSLTLDQRRMFMAALVHPVKLALEAGATLEMALGAQALLPGEGTPQVL